ncbi:MAG: beta-lactamase family protein [Bacteroidia bacterium]|nr:beta-lactamase family protein [Bacteroidia bacterium]
MRSGIFNFVASDEFLPHVISDPTKTWTADEFIAIAAAYPYYFDPGTGFHYSNSNTAIAGKIIEIVAGSSLEFNIRTRIIDPLHFINTQYMVGGSQIPGYHPSAYYVGEYDPNVPELSELFDISYTGATGAAISDIYELRPYVEALAGGEFLSPALQQKRLDCHEAGNPHGLKYGMGIFEYKGFYGHNGGMFGFTSLMVNSPDRNCTIIIWYNCQLHENDPTDFLYIIPKMIYPDL